MPNPRRVRHSRGTSWEITYRVDGRMVRKIKLPGMPHRRLQAFTADDVGALLEHAPPRDYAALALGVGTGMRQGEVLGLTLPHLRLLARELSVEQQCPVVPGGSPEITPELKTAASRRVLPLPHFVVLRSRMRCTARTSG